MADDALAGWNAVARRKLMVDRMAAFVLGNGRVGGEAQAAVAKLRIGPRMHGRAVVGVDYVAARATAGAIVAWVVVGAEKVQRWIHEPRFGEGCKYWVHPVLGAEPPIAQPRAWPAIFFQPLWVAQIGTKAAAAFKESQYVAGLFAFVPRQWFQKFHDRLEVCLVLRRRRHGLQSLACPVHGVALAEGGLLVGHRSVVVEGCTPEHAAVGHHALANLQHHACMATAAADVCNPQVAGIHKPNKLWRFVVEQRIRPNRIRRTGPGFFLGGMDVAGLLRNRRAVAPMAVRAAQSHIGAAVHVAHPSMAGDAALALEGNLFQGLVGEIDPEQFWGQRIGIGRLAGRQFNGWQRDRQWLICLRRSGVLLFLLDNNRAKGWLALVGRGFFSHDDRAHGDG